MEAKPGRARRRGILMRYSTLCCGEVGLSAYCGDTYVHGKSHILLFGLQHPQEGIADGIIHSVAPDRKSGDASVRLCGSGSDSHEKHYNYAERS